MCMLGAASFMNWRGGIKTAHGIFWFAAAGILGWPFASALCAPYLLEELVLVLFSDKDAFIESIIRFFRGVIAGLIVLVSAKKKKKTRDAVLCSSPRLTCCSSLTS